jgi:hypothetical protein
VNDTLTITPSVIIRRSRSTERGIEVLDVPSGAQESGERALLVFASPEIAETFRADTGCYTEEEGYKVMPSDAEQLRVILWGADFKSVAVRGLEYPEQVAFFDVVDFMWHVMKSEYDAEKPLG